MLDKKDLRLRYRNMGALNRWTLAAAVTKLPEVFSDNDLPDCITPAFFNDRGHGLLAVTPAKLYFIDKHGHVTSFAYSEIHSLTYNEGVISNSIKFFIQQSKFSFTDIIDDDFTYRYLLGKVPAIANSSENEFTAMVSIYAQKSVGWKIRNTLLILLPNCLLLSFLSFWLMYYRTKYVKYKKIACVYTVLFIIFFIFIHNDTIKNIYMFSWLIGIILIFISLKEYLFRLANRQAHTPIPASTSKQQLKPVKSIETITVEQSEKELTANYYLSKMQQLNVAITDEQISNYLDNMEKICDDIFSYVEKHPEQQTQIQSFTSYYLPETFKLLESYDDLSKRAVKTESITQTMEEITEALGTILEAFTTLYNQLFQNKAINISTDIKVLKDVLTQHGLTKESSTFDFKQ